jgi:hypothetical protein
LGATRPIHAAIVAARNISDHSTWLTRMAYPDGSLDMAHSTWLTRMARSTRAASPWDD